MFNTPVVAGIAFYVFYAVAFTKFLFDGVGKPGKDKQGNPTPGNPSLQNGLVRLWALVLGVVGAVVDAHFGGNLTTGPPLYEAVKNGVIGTVFAVLTYHVGNSEFINPLDGTTTTTATTTVTTTQAVNPSVVTTGTIGSTPPVPPAGIVTYGTTTSVNGTPVMTTSGHGALLVEAPAPLASNVVQSDTPPVVA